MSSPSAHPSSLYENRRAAGRAVAEAVAELDLVDPVVLALPRGGVPIGFEVAVKLGVPLDVLVVRKLGVPGHEELAMGAIASGDVQSLNADVIDLLRVPPEILDEVVVREQRELRRREQAYRGDRPPVPIAGHSVVVVDDGLATGATMRAAVESLRARGPRSIIVAVPVGARSTCAALRPKVDQLVCLAQPDPFYGVGLWYRTFDQTSDDEVRRLLAQASGQFRAVPTAKVDS